MFENYYLLIHFLNIPELVTPELLDKDEDSSSCTDIGFDILQIYFDMCVALVLIYNG